MSKAKTSQAVPKVGETTTRQYFDCASRFADAVRQKVEHESLREQIFDAEQRAIAAFEKSDLEKVKGLDARLAECKPQFEAASATLRLWEAAQCDLYCKAATLEYDDWRRWHRKPKPADEETIRSEYIRLENEHDAEIAKRLEVLCGLGKAVAAALDWREKDAALTDAVTSAAKAVRKCRDAYDKELVEAKERIRREAEEAARIRAERIAKVKAEEAALAKEKAELGL